MALVQCARERIIIKVIVLRVLLSELSESLCHDFLLIT